MTDFDLEKPKLRALDIQPVEYEGSSYLMLRDPLLIQEQPLFVPQDIVPLLVLSDGTRNLAGLRGAMLMRYGINIPLEQIRTNLEVLDGACLLDNGRFAQAQTAARLAYRNAPYRAAACAGSSYPQDATALRKLLQSYLEAVSPPQTVSVDTRGLVSPHIDYQRGGTVYARTWGAAAEAVRAADLAIILGTDHYSEGLPISLTRQNYASPLGVLPTAVEIVDALAQRCGAELAFRGELHHRREHSIELAAVWMQHIRQGQAVATVPILVGPLDGETGLTEAILAVLSNAMQGRRVLVIAAGDLAHVGPAFDTPAFDAAQRQLLQRSDQSLIEAICQGDAEGFRAQIQAVQDANNICGIWPIYLALRLLAPTSGQALGYDICPADEDGASFVSIGGVALC